MDAGCGTGSDIGSVVFIYVCFWGGGGEKRGCIDARIEVITWDLLF